MRHSRASAPSRCSNAAVSTVSRRSATPSRWERPCVTCTSPPTAGCWWPAVTATDASSPSRSPRPAARRAVPSRLRHPSLRRPVRGLGARGQRFRRKRPHRFLTVAAGARGHARAPVARPCVADAARRAHRVHRPRPRRRARLATHGQRSRPHPRRHHHAALRRGPPPPGLARERPPLRRHRVLERDLRARAARPRTAARRAFDTGHGRLDRRRGQRLRAADRRPRARCASAATAPTCRRSPTSRRAASTPATSASPATSCTSPTSTPTRSPRSGSTRAASPRSSSAPPRQPRPATSSRCLPPDSRRPDPGPVPAAVVG
jgi:hypothetical protein